jgi:hypothetical protein
MDLSHCAAQLPQAHLLFFLSDQLSHHDSLRLLSSTHQMYHCPPPHPMLIRTAPPLTHVEFPCSPPSLPVVVHLSPIVASLSLLLDVPFHTDLQFHKSYPLLRRGDGPNS